MTSPVQRRRSHSASPAPGLSPSDDRHYFALAAGDSVASHVAAATAGAVVRTKRPRAAASPLSPSYRDLSACSPPRKWDVDMWRRGKRARTEKPSCEQPASVPATTFPMFCALPPASAPTLSFAPLPSTSAAFHFFPTPAPAQARARRTTRRTSIRGSGSSRASCELDRELTRLRARAFSELHRSVEESGEGLVRRMRDWEEDRAQPVRASGPTVETSRRRRHTADSDPLGYGDERAVAQDNAAVDELDPSWSRSSKKRAMSMGDVEMELDQLEDMRKRGRCSSPIDVDVLPPLGTGSSESWSCSSDSEVEDDDDDVEFALQPPSADASPFPSPPTSYAFTPPLSDTLTASTNSSLVSLPLPPPISPPGPFAFEHAAFTPITASTMPTPTPGRPGLVHIPSHASRTEKAIAALSLALANGAGGMDDYGSLMALDGVASPGTILSGMEEGVGELWG